jgi:hypothetical protein
VNECKPLLAGIMAEHVISATAAGKIAGRVLGTMAPHAELARMLLGGSTENAAEAKVGRCNVPNTCTNKAKRL